MADATLCISCNRPAPEFDKYADLISTLLSIMASGITLLRLSQEKPREVPHGLLEWKLDANAALHLGNDFTQERHQTRTIHSECDAWKITYRRVNALLRDLHFELRLVQGLGVH